MWLKKRLSFPTTYFLSIFGIPISETKNGLGFGSLEEDDLISWKIVYKWVTFRNWALLD